MAITGSGLYFLTIEKFLTGALTESLEAEDNKIMLDSDTDTPNFDTHDFRNDVATEVTGTNWASGGVALTTTEVTVSSGILTFGAANVSVASTTITNAMAAIHYFNVGTAATDPLFGLWDFVTNVSTSNGTFGITWAGGAMLTIDLVP